MLLTVRGPPLAARRRIRRSQRKILSRLPSAVLFRTMCCIPRALLRHLSADTCPAQIERIQAPDVGCVWSGADGPSVLVRCRRIAQVRRDSLVSPSETGVMTGLPGNSVFLPAIQP